MRANVMIKITDIKKQVIENDLYGAKQYFDEIINYLFDLHSRTNTRWTDSDLEHLQDELAGRGFYVTWRAIANFFELEWF